MIPGSPASPVGIGSIPSPRLLGGAVQRVRDIVRRPNFLRDWGAGGAARLRVADCCLLQISIVPDGRELAYTLEILTADDYVGPPAPDANALTDFLVVLWRTAGNRFFCGIHQPIVVPQRAAGAPGVKRAGSTVLASSGHLFPARPDSRRGRHTFGGRALNIFRHLLGDTQALTYKKLDRTFVPWLHAQLPRFAATGVRMSDVVDPPQGPDALEEDTVAARRTWNVYHRRRNLVGLNLYWGIVRAC